ncbi:Concanavalin A-like lectin/glucanase [Niveomyces insectorum RCEF 264]|uniref:Concanavalin A-like lectin/glucanase n=1 Tax=Niveomyces insectorum RCEF 264 TaxID=1081102 RepID=A0A167P2G8_9HYPO|nr:Concanavalin A-like lectin/glucanase [Niveomyces insectorum RCEF 264]
MRTSHILSLATALAARLSHAAPYATTVSDTDAELELLTPEFQRLAFFDTLTPNATTAANSNSNTTTCGAFETAGTDDPMYVAVSAVFIVPQVSSRPLFNWTRDPEVTPRIAVSAGLDGIECPETVRAGIYATVFQNGTQQQVPFVEFNGHVYAVRIASVAAGEHVRVRLSIVQDDVVNINWSNLNRTEQAFNRDISTGGTMCGKTVSWFVEDLVPIKAAPGDYFAAFEPVHFMLLEGEKVDGNTVHFDTSTANFTTEQALCKVAQEGTDLTITST